MKLLIATPAYGGLLTTGYAHSALQTKDFLSRNNIDVHFYFIDNESLIQKGRNQCASYALKEKYDRIIFIDADIRWTVDDIVYLINSSRLVIGGTYPCKAVPIRLSFNPLPKDIDLYFGGVCDRGVKGFRKFKESCADENGEVEVLHVPTGFLQIRIEVLQKLAESVPQYMSAGNLQYNFFPVRVTPEGVLESEDWGFCSLCREHGIPVYMQTKSVLAHTGSYEFKAAV